MTPKRMTHLLTALLVSVLILGSTSATQAAASKSGRPNIILFFTDDQGWADTSVPMMAGRADSRSDICRTPHLGRMAREGMVFSNAYSPAPVCSPSRDSILYGQTPTRLHHSILLGKANCPPDALTTPRAVKATDPRYITAHFGKWACSPRTPEEAGFDVSDGRTDNWHGDWRTVDGHKETLPEDDPKRIFSVTQRANAFMEKQVETGRPFYMRISHYAVHVGHDALKETVEKYVLAGRRKDEALYAAMTEDLDTGLGAVLDKLDSLGIADNTYVIFTSDNGGGFHGNGPLNGGKASLWEGGIRVPMVVRGPGIEPGTYCDVPVVGWDFLPTFCDLAGNSGPPPERLDGGSLRSVFENGNLGNVDRPVEPLIFHYPWFDNVPMSVIRLGDYKLVKDLNTNRFRLFNVARDIEERKDLSESMPELAKRMHEQLTDYLDDVNAEKLEDLRTWREETLRGWMERDEKTIEDLKQQIVRTTDAQQRATLQSKYLDLQRRHEGHQTGMMRVEKGRRVTAW
ncbi:MAG: sulfatase [Thermoguttaceae bacterium]